MFQQKKGIFQVHMFDKNFKEKKIIWLQIQL